MRTTILRSYYYGVLIPMISVMNRVIGIFYYISNRIQVLSVNKAGWYGSSQASTGVEQEETDQPVLNITALTYRKGSDQQSAVSDSSLNKAGWYGSSQASTGVEQESADQPAKNNKREDGKMRSSRLMLSVFGCFLLNIFFTGSSQSIQIATKFADVVLEMLQPGMVYNLTAAKKLPLTVENRSPEITDVKIDVVIPRESDLIKDYEPIPSEDWVKLVPNSYRLKPREFGNSDIVISIPDDKSLIGKHYQVMFHVQSYPIGGPQFNLGLAGMMVSATIYSRLRFSIGTMGPKALKMEKIKKRMLTLDLELMPMNIEFDEEIRLGKKVILQEKDKPKLKLVNKAEETLKLNMISVQPDIMYGPFTKGYDFCPDPNFLKIVPGKVGLKGNTIIPLKMYLKIPRKEEYYGRKFVFVIKAQLAEEVPVEIYSKIYVTTEGKKKASTDTKEETK
jgi:hypothetical protein